MPAAVHTRRMTFEYPDGEHLPRHFVSGDPAMSHIVAMLSAMFPDGEDFFVRSVRACRDDITDPVLAPQVKGFIGQEAHHREGGLAEGGRAELLEDVRGVGWGDGVEQVGIGAGAEEGLGVGRNVGWRGVGHALKLLIHEW